ncbi:MAG TPA: hypothetical protein VLO11_03330, partial [Luteolibacter sp.]|nr:hypothetical protein [Luteolibacter sp.]
MKPISFRIPLAVTIAVVGSCAPKAIVVEESAPTLAEQETKNEEKPEVEPEPVIAGPPDDGIRLPDML